MGMGIVTFITSLFLSLKGRRDRKQAQEDIQEYQASQSYAAAVRSVALMRQQRQLNAELATKAETSVKEIDDLQTQMQKAVENANLVKGTQGPVVKSLPVEQILLPAALALALKMILK